MRLFKYLKHYKRHEYNKHLRMRADTIHWLADINIRRHCGDRLYIVSPLMFNIIVCNNDYVPDNIRCSKLIIDNTSFVETMDGRKWDVNEVIKYDYSDCGIEVIRYSY